MKIAYISADFGVHIFGYKGASIHVREMVNAFRAFGHSVCIFSSAMHDGKVKDVPAEPVNIEKFEAYKSFYPDNPKDAIRQGEVIFVEVRPSKEHLEMMQKLAALDRFLGRKTRLKQELRNLMYNFDLMEQVGPHLQKWPVDFIYERYSLFSLAGTRLAREADVPHILEVNAPLAYEQEKMRGLEMKNLAKELEAHIFQQSDHVIVVSEALKSYVLDCGVPEDRVTVLPNGVDVRRFSDSIDGTSIRQTYNLAGKQLIGFVGSLKPWHGVDSLIYAIDEISQEFPQAHLLIVGDGPMREKLETIVRERNLTGRVTFTGKVEYEEIPQYIAAMDIATAPYPPNENFYFSPIKLFEYMAMGKPVVAGAIGQISEIINQPETGLLFEPGNLSQLVENIKLLLSDANLRYQIGKAAREFVLRERTWENNANQVIELAKTLIYRRTSES